MTIPNEAIEAAARGMFAHCGVQHSWDEMSEGSHEIWRRYAKDALEAALPFLVPVPDAEPAKSQAVLGSATLGRTVGATPATGANSADQVGRVRDAIISTMFAPHELPLTDDRLLMNYTHTAKAAIAAMNRDSRTYDDGLRKAAEIAQINLDRRSSADARSIALIIRTDILAELGKPEGEKG